MVLWRVPLPPEENGRRVAGGWVGSFCPGYHLHFGVGSDVGSLFTIGGSVYWLRCFECPQIYTLVLQ